MKIHGNERNQYCLDERDYFLRDLDMENTWNMSVQTSIERAKKTPLLRGWTVYMTPNTKPGEATLKHLVLSHGGKVCRFNKL